MLKHYVSTNYLSMILYAAFGGFLGMAGISVVNKPFEWLIIFILVILIDVNSSYVMFKSMSKDE